MVKVNKVKQTEQSRQARKMRAIDERVEYERLRDGLRLEHRLSFQK